LCAEEAFKAGYQAALAKEVAHATAALQAENEKLRAEVERLSSYYKNGIECFANPCEKHSGENTPPFDEFFAKYGGQCLICVVDNNKALQAENEKLRAEVERLGEKA
jgi:cell division protein FtsB